MTIREEYEAWLVEHGLDDHAGRYSMWLRTEIYNTERDAHWGANPSHTRARLELLKEAQKEVLR